MLGSAKTLPAVLRASLTWDQREMRDCKQVAVDADIDGRISERLAHSATTSDRPGRDARRATGCTHRSGHWFLELVWLVGRSAQSSRSRNARTARTRRWSSAAAGRLSLVKMARTCASTVLSVM